MDLYFNNTKLSIINIIPSTTINDLKTTLSNWLHGQGIMSYTIDLVFNDGSKLNPIVFSTKDYDAINFQQHARQLQGGAILINQTVTAQPEPSIPVLYERQIPHLNRLVDIIKEWHVYMDTSPMGSGKTYVTCAIAKAFNLTLSVIAPLTLLPKWKQIASLFKLNIAEFGTYHSIRGTKIYQPESKYITRFGDDFEITEHFSKLIRPDPTTNNSGLLLVFDEVHKLKNNSSQSRAAHTLVRRLIESNRTGFSNSRVGLISATPADKQKHSDSIAKLLGLTLQEKLYSWDPGNKKYDMYGLEDVYNWCLDKNFNLAREIYNVHITKLNIGEVTFRLVAEIAIPHLSSSMPAAPLGNYYNGFFTMSPTDQMRLKAAVNQLKMAAARGVVEIFPDEDEEDHEKLNITDQGLGKMTLALRMIESIKVPIVVRLARYVLDQNPNSKVVLYFNYKKGMESTFDSLQNYNPLMLYGKVPPKQRIINIDLFQQNNNNHRVMIANPHVADVGIDLDDKYGNHPRTMFVIPDYRFIPLYQASGRINRADSKSVGTVFFVYGKSDEGVTETKIFDSLARKSFVAQQYTVATEIPPFPGEFQNYYEPDL